MMHNVPPYNGQGPPLIDTLMPFRPSVPYVPYYVLKLPPPPPASLISQSKAFVKDLLDSPGQTDEELLNYLVLEKAESLIRTESHDVINPKLREHFFGNDPSVELKSHSCPAISKLCSDLDLGAIHVNHKRRLETGAGGGEGTSAPKAARSLSSD